MTDVTDTPAEPRRIDYLPLDALQPATRNPKRHDLPAIGRSIDRFGYIEPVILDERTGRLVAGHGRTEQLRAEADAGAEPPDGIRVVDGAWQVPVVRGWSSRDDAEAEAYLAASNRLVELGGWDEAELGAMLADVAAADADLALIAGFDGAELARLLEAAQHPYGAHNDPDDVPPVPAEPVTRPGDVWLLGPHRLVCGDSTDPAVLDRLMAGGLADCVWTDPPYNVAVVGGTHDPRDRKNHGKGPRIVNDAMSDADFRDFLDRAFAATYGVMREGGPIYVCHADTEGLNFRGAFVGAGFLLHEVLIWAKQEFVFGRSDYHWQHEPILYGWKPGAAHTWVGDRTQSTVWNVDRPMRSAMEHPTQKPVALPEKALSNSTNFAGTVLDPFAGSGSTLIACHGTGRIARLVELDPAYCDVICHRYQAHTGDVPVLEATGEPHDFTAAG